MKNIIKQITFNRPKVQHTIFFFDYDGTLFPFSDNISESFLQQEVLTNLDLLNKKPKISVGLVTGRGLDDIKKFVPLKDMIYITNHGFLIEYDQERMFFTEDLNKEKHWLSRHEKIVNQLKAFPQIFIEKKELSTSFHYRNVPAQDQARCKKHLESVIRSFFGVREATIKEGKQMVELLPHGETDKGLAMEYIVNRIKEKENFQNVQVIFMGDDKSDEDGFEYINSINQISIKIGEGDTLAQYRLADTNEVHNFIKELITIL